MDLPQDVEMSDAELAAALHQQFLSEGPQDQANAIPNNTENAIALLTALVKGLFPFSEIFIFVMRI
jgi:hypothetical protein